MEKEVELSSTQVKKSSLHISQPQQGKGGIATMPFIIANEALARVATLGLLPNMVLYLMGSYNLHLSQATQILLLSVATTNFTPLVGAFIADSYLGRFLAVGLGSIITFLGMALLWLTSMIQQARPPPCTAATEICKSATTGQITMLISSLALMSIGNGGLQCSLAFGADQVNRKDNPNNDRALEIFFSWYYASSAISVIIAFTGIVYIQDHLGWKLGFGVPALLMFLSTFFFFLASPLYVKNKTNGSLLSGFAQVIVVTYKKRKLRLPPKNSAAMYHRKQDSDLVVPTDKLRFLNKACFIMNPEKDIAPDGSASNPWSLCTIDQVEELKAIFKVIPLWSTGIMMSLNIGGSFGLLQAKSLNRHITPNFEVPAGSLTVIMIFTIFIWIALYDRVILPLASKFRGKPVRISAKRRMGMGLFFSFLHLVTAAIVETIRRRRAIREGYIDNPHAVLNMSAMWLFPQLCLGGIAEAFNVIGQNEFYYTEFPKTMSSIASSLFGLAMAAGYVVSSLVFKIVENFTSRGGNDGWISDNINKGRYDKYYWVLATLSAVNILYYLVCSWAYGPTADQESKATEDNGLNEEALPLITDGPYDKVSQETLPVQQMMDWNHNWWSMNTPSSLQHVLESSSIPFKSSTENPEPPLCWRQLHFTGLHGEEERLGFSHVESNQLENWDDHDLNPSAIGPIVDVVKQEVSQGGNLYGCVHDEFQDSGAGPSWSQIVPVSYPRSGITSLKGNNSLDFTCNKADHRKKQLPNHTSECNSTASYGVCNKAMGQPSSNQPPLTVRKEKLGDKITALQQLVAPFGKTDTASVLLEAIGYIKFLQGQIEDAIEKPKDLRSRGLCLVPISFTHHSEKGNSTATSGVCVKATGQPSSNQPPLTVRKEKLGDRITALHQLVCPFGKTDTASVLLEVIGYIKFLQGQIEILSSPDMGSGSEIRRNEQSVSTHVCVCGAIEEPKDLRSRGLCLVPISSTPH